MDFDRYLSGSGLDEGELKNMMRIFLSRHGVDVSPGLSTVELMRQCVPFMDVDSDQLAFFQNLEVGEGLIDRSRSINGPDGRSL